MARVGGGRGRRYPRCVRQAAEKAGYATRDIVSGAGHNAVYVARVAPTTMIFVPCLGGISHNEAESPRSRNVRPEPRSCSTLSWSTIAAWPEWNYGNYGDSALNLPSWVPCHGLH